MGWVGWNFADIDWKYHAGFGAGDSQESTQPKETKESES